MNPLFDPEKVFGLLKGRASDAELYQVRSESYPIVFKSNRLHTAESNFACGAGLRVIAGGRIGFSAGNDPAKLESLVQRALKSAQFGEKAAFTLPGDSPNGKAPVVYDKAAASFSRDAKINEGRTYLDGILPVAEKVNVDLEITTAVSETFLHNTRGLALSRARSVFSCGFSVLNVDQNGLLWISDGNTSCRLDFRRKEQTEKALRLLKLAARVVPCGKPETVILEPPVVSILISSFLLGINGKTVYKGSSPLADKTGRNIADPRLTLTEEPFLDFKPASGAFDGEGVPARRNVLIENGVLKMFVYDLQTAGLAKADPTGNGGRGYASLPSPAYGNLSIPAGSRPVNDIIKGTKNGLWIHSVLGSGQSNMLAGDFSLNAHLAYRVENGEITGRVKDTMISGNVYDIFNKLTEVGAEIDDSGSSLFPAMAFSGIQVSC